MAKTIKNLVKSIRAAAAIQQISREIATIAEVVSEVIAETRESRQADDVLDRLTSCRQRLLEASVQGKDLALRDLRENNRGKWREWTQTLALITSEIVVETKELVQRVDRMILSPTVNGFS